MTTAPCEKTAVSLVPKLSAAWVLNWRHAIVFTWFGIFSMYLGYVPLFHSDIWGHVHYGKWMLEHKTVIVPEDPFMPLAEGMQSVNNAWLSQVLFAQLYAWGGPHYLSFTFALVGLASYLIYYRAFYLISKNVLVALAGVMLVLSIGWTRHAIIRPENFGVLAVATLFWMLVRCEPWRSRALVFVAKDNGENATTCPWWMWLAVPALFMAWANAHGSFAVGLVILACHAAGRILEVAWATRNVEAVGRDSWVRTWVLLTQVAVLATLVNPYGVDMLIETATFGANPNLRDILEWYPLKLMDLEGIHFMVSILILIVVVRHSRQRFHAAEILMVLFFAAMSAPTIRMLGWYAPAFALAMLPHITDLTTRFARYALPQPTAEAEPVSQPSNNDNREPQDGMDFVWTLICPLIAWVSFSLSPISQPVLGGYVRTPEKVYSKSTPLGVTKFLREKSVTGLIFAPQWWGDWVAWDGPPQTQVFITSHIHLVPPSVWKDCLRIARGNNGWDRALERYNVRTLVADKERQVDLIRQLRGTESWKVVYEDDIALVAQRTKAAE